MFKVLSLFYKTLIQYGRNKKAYLNWYFCCVRLYYRSPKKNTHTQKQKLIKAALKRNQFSYALDSNLRNSMVKLRNLVWRGCFQIKIPLKQYFTSLTSLLAFKMFLAFDWLTWVATSYWLMT